MSNSVSQTCNHYFYQPTMAEYNKTQIVRAGGRVGPHLFSEIVLVFKKAYKKQAHTRTHTSLASLSNFQHHPVCF